jgi:hypothetical protein
MGGRAEHGDRGFRRDEPVPAQRDELANGHAVSRDHERLPIVQLAHDLAALVA